MTFKELYTALSSIPMSANESIPCAYYQFPEDDPAHPAPTPPFIVYYTDGSDDMIADGKNYKKIRPVTVELYTSYKDFALEGTVEAALNNAGLVFSRSETYIQSERLYMVAYDSEIVLTEELPNG